MSNKFTGITSAGSAIPVYDKDAHSALSSKLDITAFSSVSGEFATVDDVVAAVSGKADTSAIPSLDGYATTEDVIAATSGLQPSGDYASAADLANYQPVSAMTGYQPAGSYLSANALDNVSGDWNEVSAKLDTTAFSDVSGSFLTTVPDTYLQNTDLTIVDNKITEISGVPLSAGDELPSGVMNTSALEYNAVNEISGYNGSAIAQYGAEKQWLVHDDTLVHAANSAQYALGVNVSALQRLMGIDETVLWEGVMSATGTTADFLDNIKDFERIKVYSRRAVNGVGRPFIINEFQPTFSPETRNAFVYNQVVNIESNTHQEDCMYMVLYGDTNKWTLTGGWRLNGVTQTTGVTSYLFKIEKIVGIHRISG